VISAPTRLECRPWRRDADVMATQNALSDISVAGEPVGEGEQFEAEELAVRAPTR
jgi:hypothetical protein